MYADRAYNDYKFEDFLREHAKIELIPHRKKGSKRPLRGTLRYLQSVIRKRIETAFSQITSLFPRAIHAVTAAGFETKIFSFIIALALKMLFKSHPALT